jgi:hypothetical protein
MPATIGTTANSIWSGLATGFTSFMDFVPAMIGAAVILVIGWFLASIVARLVERILLACRLDYAVARTGVTATLPTINGRQFSASHALAELGKWFIRLIFLQAAANVLHMPQVTALINSIVLFIPNLVVAILFLAVGAMLAHYVGELVKSSVGKAGIGQPAVFAMIARYAIMGFAIIGAVNQIGIATNLINILFTGLVASVALALGLSFGLGGQHVASEITRGWYETGKTQQGRLKSISGGAVEDQPKTRGSTSG